MSEKVYCSECKYCREVLYRCDDRSVCKRFTRSWDIKDTPIEKGRIVIEQVRCEVQNKNNDCEGFESLNSEFFIMNRPFWKLVGSMTFELLKVLAIGFAIVSSIFTALALISMYAGLPVLK